MVENTYNRTFKGNTPCLSLTPIIATRIEIIDWIDWGDENTNRLRDYELQDEMMEHGFIVRIMDKCPINGFSCGVKTLEDVIEWVEDNDGELGVEWLEKLYEQR